MDDDELVFTSEDTEAAEASPGNAWKILIADDEEEIHRVTKLALSGVEIAGRPLAFIDAYTGIEAVEMVRRSPDIALILMDVVMENDHAGLDAVSAIRKRLGNDQVRIVLRTGQPGQAPEREVITRYDINDYKEKTELTAKKMFTLVYTGLSLYADLLALRDSRQSLERLLGATATVLRRRYPGRLAQGVLHVIASLLGTESMTTESLTGGFALGFAPASEHLPPRLFAATGFHGGLDEQHLASIPETVLSRLRQIPEQSKWVCTPKFFAAEFEELQGHRLVFYVETEARFQVPEALILDLFHRNVAIALHSAHLHDEVERTQHELIYMLSEAIEQRSRETGNHVRRVGEYSRLFARLVGLSEQESSLLMLAAPLHDAGKIAIPDAILNKPGRLTPEERLVMETHAGAGERIFANQSLPVLRAAAIIAGQHHEKWDGSGYPNGLAGEDIHIYGRIVALADVFDALGSERCYKKAWPMSEVLALLEKERGRHFDPQLIDLMFAHLQQFIDIQERLSDSHSPAEASAA
jgi:response regulator RpfG family c-di-GMP phosphodiesterase